jgi:hypothetical protein
MRLNGARSETMQIRTLTLHNYRGAGHKALRKSRRLGATGTNVRFAKAPRQFG